MSEEDRAEGAARRVASDAGIDLGDLTVLLPGVANTVLHFPDVAVVAKVAVRERFLEAVRREHAIATELADLGAPAPRPLAGTVPTLDEPTGYVVTLWHHIGNDATATPATEECLRALEALHIALDRTTTALPPCTTELRSARAALDDGGFAAALPHADRALLGGVLDAGIAALDASGAASHRLHGEPHAANRLTTPDGVVWVDLESCCTGPREWDLAFLPEPASGYHPVVDRALLARLRVVISARFATWQSGLMHTYPHLGALATEHLAFVRDAT